MMRLQRQTAAGGMLWDDDGDEDAPLAEDLADGEPATSSRRHLRIAGGLFAAMVLVAALAPIETAVIGTGQVGVESRVKRIAHPSGGVITAIAVANGDKVQAGQLLMRLDSNVTDTDATYSSQSVEQMLAQKARLEAEQLGLGSIRFPPELTTAKSATAAQAMADENRLFQIRNAEVRGLVAQLQSRIVQHNQEIAGIEAQLEAVRKQIVLVEPERKAIQELWDRRLVTINRLTQIERTAADLEGSASALEARIAQVRAQITEAQEQSMQAVSGRRSQAGQELAQITTALGQQRVRSVAATDAQTRSEIRAPYAGTVEKLAFAAVGDVVKPAEPIMEIVPARDALVVEAAISPADIDQLNPGQPARVRFTAFNQSATPEIHGKVVYLASDRTTNSDGTASFYTARVSVDPAELKNAGLVLRPGMPADVYIRTGSRSMLSYIFKPIRDQLARAFRGD